MLRWSMLKCSSAWIAGSSPAMTNTKSFSRRVCVQVPAHDDASKKSPSREKAEGSGAPKGASNQCPRGAIRCCHLNALRARCPHPTLPRLRGGGGEGLAFRRSTAALAKATEHFGSARAALHAKERTRALPAPSITLKRSTPRPGRSAGGVDARAARERGYEPRPQEPHPLHQSAVTGDVPRTNGHCCR